MSHGSPKSRLEHTFEPVKKTDRGPNYKEARWVAEQHRAVGPKSDHLKDYPDNPFSPPVEPVECAILDSATIATEWGYVFFYNSKEYVETGELGPGETSTATVIFLSPSAAPRSIWPGRTLRACEGARVVATAEVLGVHNPVLRADEPLYEVVLGGEVMGRSPLTGRDPGMAMASGPFKPTFAFSKVESVFASTRSLRGTPGPRMKPS